MCQYIGNANVLYCVGYGGQLCAELHAVCAGQLEGLRRLGGSGDYQGCGSVTIITDPDPT